MPSRLAVRLDALSCEELLQLAAAGCERLRAGAGLAGRACDLGSECGRRLGAGWRLPTYRALCPLQYTRSLTTHGLLHPAKTALIAGVGGHFRASGHQAPSLESMQLYIESSHAESDSHLFSTHLYNTRQPQLNPSLPLDADVPDENKS